MPNAPDGTTDVNFIDAAFGFVPDAALGLIEMCIGSFFPANRFSMGLGSACAYQSPDPAAIKKNIEETKTLIQLCHDVDGSGVKVRPNGLSADAPAEKTLRQIGRALTESDVKTTQSALTTMLLIFLR